MWILKARRKGGTARKASGASTTRRTSAGDTTTMLMMTMTDVEDTGPATAVLEATADRIDIERTKTRGDQIESATKIVGVARIRIDVIIAIPELMTMRGATMATDAATMLAMMSGADLRPIPTTMTDTI